VSAACRASPRSGGGGSAGGGRRTLRSRLRAHGEGRLPDEGSGTIWVMGLMAVIWLVAITTMVAGGVRAARHRAHASADGAALAAAAHAAEGPAVACRIAAAVATGTGARLTGCVLKTGPEVTGPEVTGPEVTGPEATGPDGLGHGRTGGAESGQSEMRKGALVPSALRDGELRDGGVWQGGSQQSGTGLGRTRQTETGRDRAGRPGVGQDGTGPAGPGQAGNGQGGGQLADVSVVVTYRGPAWLGALQIPARAIAAPVTLDPVGQVPPPIGHLPGPSPVTCAPDIRCTQRQYSERWFVRRVTSRTVCQTNTFVRHLPVKYPHQLGHIRCRKRRGTSGRFGISDGRPELTALD
jgi:secretion/DNA translocation related TadE-like protein